MKKNPLERAKKCQRKHGDCFKCKRKHPCPILRNGAIAEMQYLKDKNPEGYAKVFGDKSPKEFIDDMNRA